MGGGWVGQRGWRGIGGRGGEGGGEGGGRGEGGGGMCGATWLPKLASTTAAKAASR